MKFEVAPGIPFHGAMPAPFVLPWAPEAIVHLQQGEIGALLDIVVRREAGQPPKWKFVTVTRVFVGTDPSRAPTFQEVEVILQYEWGAAKWTNFGSEIESANPQWAVADGNAWLVKESILPFKGEAKEEGSFIRFWAKHGPSGAEFERQISLYWPKGMGRQFHVYAQNTLEQGTIMPPGYK